jgi:ATP-dependent Lon protease
MKEFKDMYLAGGGDEHTEFIPLIADDGFDDLSGIDLPETLPILPLKNTVIFPGIILPIAVSREKSMRLVKEVNRKGKILGTVAQKNPDKENTTFRDFYRVGTLAKIVKMLEMPDGSVTVIIQGKSRFRIRKKVTEEPFYTATYEILTDKRPDPNNEEYKALVGSIKDIAIRMVKLSNMQQDGAFALKNIESNAFLINFISANTELAVSEKQSLLEEDNLTERAKKLLKLLGRELQMFELKNDIQLKVKKDINQQQREYMLNQQIKMLQNELGGNPQEKEMEEMKKKAKTKKWGKEVAQTFNKELKKLSRINPSSPEYSIQVNYLQTLIDIPWNEYTADNKDLKLAQDILDEDHFGLEKVKDRVLEHLAVLNLKNDLKSPILCLIGPPGVGKTSLGRSVARALGRKYIRLSLGGMHDESEIRGHRKTYIGAMPGRIMQSIKKAGSANPVCILDEVDKLGRGIHGDPSSALLEVLDPEQNDSFHDNYLELDFDLSKTLFVATANSSASIYPALLDRMELINVNGYIVEEKIEIARRHLIPKQFENHGIESYGISIPEKTIEDLIENYTRESGVRELDKKIAKISRNLAKKISMEEEFDKNLSPEFIQDILGISRYGKEKYQGNEFPGVVTGLAWTAVGGDILYVETSLSKGKGKLSITGNLGDVMKESATLALAYIKAHADLLHVTSKEIDNKDVHLHVPEGAIPKDGPSAGITMVTSLASALTGRKVKEGLAMTGEITLRGKVLPVGGIKEKILAAKRADIKEIILSEENKKDIEDIKEQYIKGLTFHFVKTITDVLKIALL